MRIYIRGRGTATYHPEKASSIPKRKKSPKRAKSSARASLCWAPVEKKDNSPENISVVGKTAEVNDAREKKQSVPVRRNSLSPKNSSSFDEANRRRAELFRKHYEEEVLRLSSELGLNKKKKKKKKLQRSPKNESKQRTSIDPNDYSVSMMISQKLSLLEESKHDPEMKTEDSRQQINWVDTHGRFVQMVTKDENIQRAHQRHNKKKMFIDLTRQAKASLQSPGPGYSPGYYRKYGRKKRRSKRRAAHKSRPTWMDSVLKHSASTPGPASYSDGVNKSSVRRKDGKTGLRFSTASRLQYEKARSPGPGEYSPVQSTLRTTGVPHFQRDSTRHLDTIIKKAASTPGPADYGPEITEKCKFMKRRQSSETWNIKRAFKSMRNIGSRTV